jgi:choloylglycine hydrolase
MQASSSLHQGFGCTDFQFTAQDRTVFAARTMDFPIPMGSKLTAFSRDQWYTSKAPDGTDGLRWQSKYGFVGIIPFGLAGAVAEGLNEEGLSFGCLWLEDSEYQKVPDDQKNRALTLIDVGKWILGSFATVDEVRSGIKGVKIWGEKIDILNRIPQLHIALHDAKGNNLVIEFINGDVIIHDNPLGVLTNEPPFSWHLKNLAGYNYLSSNNTADVVINGKTIKGESGMVGLPGGLDPKSRFVRIATAVRFALKPQTAMEGIVQASHLLNLVDVTKGLAQEVINGRLCQDTTWWSSIKDLTHKIFYYRSYDDLALRMINIAKLNFTSGQTYNQLPVEALTPTLIDVTAQLAPN